MVQFQLVNLSALLSGSACAASTICCGPEGVLPYLWGAMQSSVRSEDQNWLCMASIGCRQTVKIGVLGKDIWVIVQPAQLYTSDLARLRWAPCMSSCVSFCYCTCGSRFRGRRACEPGCSISCVFGIASASGASWCVGRRLDLMTVEVFSNHNSMILRVFSAFKSL